MSVSSWIQTITDIASSTNGHCLRTLIKQLIAQMRHHVMMSLEFKSQRSDFDWLKSDRAKALPSSSSEKIKIRKLFTNWWRNHARVKFCVHKMCGNNEANVYLSLSSVDQASRQRTRTSKSSGDLI